MFRSTFIRRCLGGAALAGCATFASPAAAADPPLRLRVGGNSLVLPPSLLTAAPDVDGGRSVTIRSADGSATAAQRGGTSAKHLIELLGIPADAIDGLEVQAGSGRSVTISGDELRSGFGGDPACAACQATFDLSPSDGGPRFLRPLRDGSDDNAADALDPRAGQSLFVRVVDPRPAIVVNAAVDRGNPRPGQAVRFTVRAFGAPADTRYTWYFGDGTTATGKTATHRFDAGSWPSGVIATAPGQYGVSALVVRAVEPPDDDPTPTPRTTAEPTAAVTEVPPAATDAAVAPGPLGTAGASPTTPSSAQTPTTTSVATPTPAVTPPAPVTPALIPVSGILVAPSPGGVSRAETIPPPTVSGDRSNTPPADDRQSSETVRSASSGILLLGVLMAGALHERRRARRSLLP